LHALHTRSALCIAALLLPLGSGAQEQVLGNWFNDPFVQLSADVAHCPPPLGPYSTEAGRRAQAHHRAEKGTSCYLAGECDKPSYYAYDADIAQGVRVALQHAGELHGTSLWLTVQGRVVYLEGCVPAPAAATAARLERLARSVPQVQQALAIVFVADIADVAAAAGGRLPPYRIVPPR